MFGWCVCVCDAASSEASDQWGWGQRVDGQKKTIPVLWSYQRLIEIMTGCRVGTKSGGPTPKLRRGGGEE